MKVRVAQISAGVGPLGPRGRAVALASIGAALTSSYVVAALEYRTALTDNPTEPPT